MCTQGGDAGTVNLIFNNSSVCSQLFIVYHCIVELLMLIG